MKKRFLAFVSSLVMAVSALGGIAVGGMNVTANAETTGNVANGLTVDFGASTDANAFTAMTLDGWTIGEDGRYHPAQDGAMYNASSFKLNEAIPLAGTKYISFDFYAASKTFDIGLLSTAAENIWGTALFIHTPYVDDTTAVTSNVDTGSYYGGLSTNYADADVHNIKLTVTGGKVTYTIDNTELSFNGATFDIPADNAYLMIRAVGKDSFIDNLKISNEDIPYVEPTLDTTYQEATIEFNTGDDTKYFTAFGNGGWSIDEGEFFPKTSAWAASYLTQPIPMNGEKYLSFDFLAVPDNGDVSASQFNMVFMTDLATSKCSAGIHCFMNGTQAILTVNRAMGKDQWIADSVFDWADGNYHNMKIAIKNGTVTFFVDGAAVQNANEETVTVSLDSDQQAAETYFVLQATNVMTCIDNLVISNSDIAYVAPTTETVEFEKVDYDFSDDTANADFVKTASSGNVWAANADGKLAPVSNWSVAYLDKELPLSGELTVAMKFNVSAETGGHQLLVGISKEKESYNGLFLVFYNGELQLNYCIGPYNRSVSTASTSYFDGEEHVMKLIVSKNKAAVLIDNKVVFKDVYVGMQSGYLKMQSSTTADYIDDLSIKPEAEALSIPDPTGDVANKNTTVTTGTQKTDGGMDSNGLWVGLLVGSIVLTVACAAGFVFVFFVKKKKD